MARIPKLKFKVNLDQLFGSRTDVDSATRQAIGQAIIDRITARTSEDGVDKNGRKLGKYSKSYAKSLDGQVFGKKSGGPVTLLATGDMLGGMTIIEESARTLTIGWDDSAQNAKAYGHISGMAGHPFLDGKVPERDFFGLPKGELESIASDFEAQVTDIDTINKSQSREELDQAVESIIKDLSANLGDDGEG